MTTRDYLDFYKKFSGLDIEESSPLTQQASRLLSEDREREILRMAEAEDRAAIAGMQPLMKAAAIEERRKLQSSWSDVDLPAVTKADAYAVVKDASLKNEDDRGLKTASMLLYKAWTSDIDGNLTLRDLSELKSRVAMEYPKSSLQRVIDREVTAVGFSTLKDVPRLARIASEIHDQASYDAAIMVNGLDGDSNIRARAFIRGLVAVGEEGGEASPPDLYQRLAARMGLTGQENFDSNIGEDDELMDDADPMMEGDDADGGMPPHDEEGETHVELESPVTGDTLILELGVASPEGAVEGMDNVEPAGMNELTMGSNTPPTGGMAGSEGATLTAGLRYLGQLSDLPGPGIAQDSMGESIGEPTSVDALEDDVSTSESMGMIEDPSSGEMLEVVLKKVDDGGNEGEAEGEMPIDLQAGMEHCSEHDGPMHDCAEFHKTGPEEEEGMEHDAVAPPGREKQVKELKKDKDIDNPFAVAWSSYNKSHLSHHPKKAISMGDVDEHAKTELELYLFNTGELYPQFQSIIANLKKKIKAGKYDPALAPKLWQYWVDNGARSYVKEHGSTHETIKDMFPASLRRTLAAEIAEQEYELIMKGEYGDVGMKPGKGPATPPKMAFKVWATSNGETSERPLDHFEASSMAEAFQRISSFGVDGKVVADPMEPNEAYILIDDDNWLHITAEEKGEAAYHPMINQQQPNQVSIPEDGAAALASNGGFKQDRATRKVKKSDLTAEFIQREASRLQLSATEVETRLFDGEVIDRNGWFLRITPSDEVEFGKVGGASRLATMVKLDDVILDFQASVVADEDRTPLRCDIAELFKAKCASCRAVHQYVMPKEASALHCPSCGHVASAKQVSAAFAKLDRVAGAKKFNDYLVTVQVPVGSSEKEFSLNAKRMFAAVKGVNAGAELDVDEEGRVAEIVLHRAEKAAINRIEKIFSDVFGVTADIEKVKAEKKRSQFVGQTPATQAQPGVEDPSMQQHAPAMDMSPDNLQEKVKEKLNPLQPGQMNRGKPGMPSMPVMAEEVDDGDAAMMAEAMKVAQLELGQEPMQDIGPGPDMMMGDEGGGGLGESNIPEMMMPGSNPGPQVDQDSLSYQPMDVMDPEGKQAAHASLLHYRNQGMGVLDALAEFHRQYSDYLDSFGDEAAPERHLAEAEIVKIAGEVYSQPALIERAVAETKEAMRLYAELFSKEGFEAPKVNTQQPGWISKSKLKMMPDSSGKEPKFGPSSVKSQPGSMGGQYSNPKMEADSSGKEPNFGDHPFGSDAQAGSQYHQPGTSHPDPHLGPDSATGEVASTRKMEQVSKSAPGNVRSK